MQKVVGSNPISRFARKPRSGGAFCLVEPLLQAAVDRYGHPMPGNEEHTAGMAAYLAGAGG